MSPTIPLLLNSMRVPLPTTARPIDLPELTSPDGATKNKQTERVLCARTTAVIKPIGHLEANCFQKKREAEKKKPAFKWARGGRGRRVNREEEHDNRGRSGSEHETTTFSTSTSGLRDRSHSHSPRREGLRTTARNILERCPTTATSIQRLRRLLLPIR